MRQIRQRHDLQGICRSGFGMETDLAQTHAAGFSHHLTKPVDLAQLAR